MLPCKIFLLIVLRGRATRDAFSKDSEHDSDSNVHK